MNRKSDIEIANSVQPKLITDVATDAGIDLKYIEQYGKYKAKIDLRYLTENEKPDGKLILVTAMTPTAAGEGKTTTTIGLADALRRIGKNAVVALREPSLGPVFGIKGGATGGGYAQVVPMEDINLHFTGDFHAIGAANNLLAAMIDNHIYQGNALNIDVKSVTFRRCVDMNDRQLRKVIDGIGKRTDGVMREDGFDITVASEIMAILCLSSGIKDLKDRLAKIIVGYNFSGEPVTAGDLKAQGAMAALLKDAIKPNLVQTLEGTPAIVHGGPFANIAHGCNSVIATRVALKTGDYCVTEAGFGSDLGAEKFFDIKCRVSGLKPSATVVVATIRALKMHGGVKKSDLAAENVNAVLLGMPNLLRHVNIMRDVFNVPVVVAVNRFDTDTDAETDAVYKECKKLGITAIVSNVCAKGGKGGIALAEEVVRIADEPAAFKYSYDVNSSIEDKIRDIAVKVYGGAGAHFSADAKKQIEKICASGLDKLPVCIAKTQYSFSDDKDKICAPTDFKITVKNVKVSAGAGFIVALTGDIMTMPGLPKIPAAENIDIDENGKIYGLF